MDILQETMQHFEQNEQPKEQPKQEEKKEDQFAGFKSHWVGGMQVIDLTSIDDDYTEYESVNLASDVERQQIYGNKSGDSNLM